MPYSSFLSKIIKESGLSLRKIAILCEKNYNVKITASYLSKLQKEGYKNPASEKVNTAIAKVCRINPDDLNFEADLERAPETVKQTINELMGFVKTFFFQASKQFSISNTEVALNVESEINKYLNMGTREFLQALSQYSELEACENPFEMGIDLNEDNMEDLLMKFSINTPVEDNSMFPIIKQGAKIEIVQLDKYNNGDIVSATIDNDTRLIRTYVESGNDIILIPANPEFETLTIPKKDIVINGRVKSYTIEL
ncbi:MAG: S24 family peptidase [Clostridia bacterium]|nr:S24 family peptidase [Clostridia bacterium]